MFQTTRDFLSLLGIDPQRIRLEWISSAEGTRFAQVANEFTQTIKTLGPAGIREEAGRQYS